MDPFKKKLAQPVVSTWSSNVKQMLQASDDPSLGCSSTLPVFGCSLGFGEVLFLMY